MNLDDRISLILGRAVMRAESLQVQLEQALARIAELEAQAADKPAAKTPARKAKP